MEKIMNVVYSFAAAIVIFGAWAKLEHKDYGSLALTIGLLTETGIFFLYGLLEWRKKPSGSEPATPSANTEELQTTLDKTNQLINKVFRTE